jgi:hypothetical protein
MSVCLVILSETPGIGAMNAVIDATEQQGPL